MVGVGDPVGQGIVASLARPGGNVTGLSALVTDLYAKRVQLVRELVPGAIRIAALFNMSNPAIPPQWREVERTAQSLAMEPQLLDVRTPDDLARAFASASAKGADALIVGLVRGENRRWFIEHDEPTVEVKLLQDLEFLLLARRQRRYRPPRIKPERHDGFPCRAQECGLSLCTGN